MSGFQLKFSDVRQSFNKAPHLKGDHDEKTHVKTPLAIIGLSCRFGDSNDKDEFWDMLKEGKDQIRPFPDSRKQAIKDYLYSQMPVEMVNSLQFHQKSYLSDIDQFDPHLFALSPTEASLMDPNQRIFVETAWQAIEDAGYGGKKMLGTRTGVYVGYCNLALDTYLKFIEAIDPSLFTISVPGNIKSIIASRISYLLDLKGPALVLDTACSSSLTAVHIACQSLWNGECEMALAGGVKINLLPGFQNEDEDIGISSSDGRTRSFDDSSDGTGGGEGAAAILLKPYDQAIRDGDSIYAVIKGTATNQDGRSIGITAPNAAAQEDVLVQAWENAGIDPETLSYIEAHGTGTRLGDPVEIGGLEKAFRRYTDKRQFCALGSVKSNIGHLDGAAGMAGLIKVILALKQRQIPPSIHFQTPNRKINFIDSPIYLNDKLKDWTTEGYPLRCGVSSFGLSGTNAHLVLEEAPPIEGTTSSKELGRPLNMLTLSAKSKDGLLRLVQSYVDFLSTKRNAPLDSICYTANTGRGHYNYRLAIIAEDVDQFVMRLKEILVNGTDSADETWIHYGESKLVLDIKTAKGEGELTEEQKRRLSSESVPILRRLVAVREVYDLTKLADLYTRGAEIDWEGMYEGTTIPKSHVPGYPFSRIPCWLESKQRNKQAREQFLAESVMHPLLHRCLAKSMDMDVYSTQVSTDTHWELREHVLGGLAVLPGTCYVEMALEAGRLHFGTEHLELLDLLFLSPLVLSFGEVAEVHVVIKKTGSYVEFSVASLIKQNGNWTKHAEGKLQSAASLGPDIKMLEVDEIKLRCIEKLEIDNRLLENANVKTGSRWKNIHVIHVGNEEVLAELAFPNELLHELEAYRVFPSLLDGAVNAANVSMADGLFLPLHYEKARFYKKLPHRFYSYLRKREKFVQNRELASFDIVLTDDDGSIIAEIEGYTIKRMEDFENKLRSIASRNQLFHQSVWIPQHLTTQQKRANHQSVLLLGSNDRRSKQIKESLATAGVDVLEITEDCKIDYAEMAEQVRSRQITQVIHAQCLMSQEDYSSIVAFDQALHRGFYSLFLLTKELVNKQLHRDLDIILIGQNGVSAAEQLEDMEPVHACLYGLGKVIRYEYANFHVRCVDVDSDTLVETILQEISNADAGYMVSYRSGNRYMEEFREAPLELFEEDPLTIYERGVYVVTGGSSGIGLEISKYIASRQHVRLAWFGRTPIPPREEWEILLHDGVYDRASRIVTNILELEKSGSVIDYYCTDVSDERSLADAFQTIRARGESIRGVIHSAGNSGDGFIVRKDERTVENVLKPKVQGTWLLHKMTVQDNLDFFVMCSSLTSVFGAPGQSDYTAANAYQDAFAAYRSQLGQRTLTVNWSGWNEVGMAVDHNVHTNRSMFIPLSNAQGIEALDKVLNKRLSRMMIGAIDHEVFASSVSYLPVSVSPAIEAHLHSVTSGYREAASAGSSEAMNVLGKALSQLTTTEILVAGLWGEVLGLRELDIYDKFFEIGGDSLLASRLLKELDKKYPNVMDITDVFIYSTVTEMASFIDSKLTTFQSESKTGSDIEDDIDALLKKVASGEITL
ncbi:SDR family NAD(P)-dependent oxidoreductase [Paenibacillus sp. SI8]|uniref:SDR family NAD(P)-dependent oxidoreductase n=1 Tax=unclassified Paenibacillus TaxID=185978 RepID=UPI00346703E1